MHTKIMGILNITPDSFSDNQRLYDIEKGPLTDAILRRVENMISEGTEIIDIGGESTRPGFEPVSAEEECHRVIPVIEMIKKEFDTIISLDTYKALTAREGLAAGASIINDVGMLKADPDMKDVIADSDCRYVLVYNKENYVNILTGIKEALDETVSYGISCERIILDPGVGFGKTYEQNLEAIRRLPELCKLDYPVLLGTSNKSVIGNTLNLPVDQRLEGTLATTAWAVVSGASYVRVHDIESNARVIKMMESILYG